MEDADSTVATPDGAIDTETSLESRLREYEHKVTVLLNEKEVAEQEFRSNRAKFRQLFLQKEEELKRESEELMKCREAELRLEAEVESLKKEIDEAKSQVIIAHCTKENEIGLERRKCAEEIATVQRIMDERMEETRAGYEAEIRHLREKLESLSRAGNVGWNPGATGAVSETRELSLPSVGPSVLSVVSKTFAKTVDRIQGFQSDESKAEERKSSHAEDDAEFLHSTVATLQQEVTALKDKLRVADEQLSVFESNQHDMIKGCEALAKLISGESSEVVMAELDAKMKEASSDRDITISDLELHIAVLNAQKASLREDADRLRTQMNELRHSLDKERRAHHELKEFSSKANDKFLKAERARMQEMKRLHQLLSSEQMKKFEALRQEADDQSNSSVSTDDSIVAAPVPGSTSTPTKTEDSSVGSSSNKSTPAKGSDSPGESEKSKSETNPGAELQREEKQIVVSEKEWNLLQHEVESAREKFIKTCPMCANYEIRLQDAQKEQKAAERQSKSLEKALERYKEDLNRESRYRKEMEEKWLSLSKESERQITDLYRNLEAREKEFNQFRAQYGEWMREMSMKVREVTVGRDEAQQELTKLRRENDDLVGKHSAHSQELQNETINLPDTVEELQELLLRYREDLIAAKVAKETLQETLKKEKRMYKDRVLAELHQKEDLEESLNQELDELKERLFILEGVQEALEKEQKERAELKRALDDYKQRSEEVRMKDSQLIQVLKKSVEEINADKAKLEAEVHRLQCKNSSLTQDLNNSEAVQRDFVKLSQSLQVQLEKIRSSEKEVRWQEPEDVDECNSCHGGFSRSKKKQNCKHCGKVFCPDCTTKTVPYGSHGKLAKVCDVCHTLLVSNTAPYFSTDPPHTPD